jgi:hypothetical protein
MAIEPTLARLSNKSVGGSGVGVAAKPWRRSVAGTRLGVGPRHLHQRGAPDREGRPGHRPAKAAIGAALPPDGVAPAPRSRAELAQLPEGLACLEAGFASVVRTARARSVFTNINKTPNCRIHRGLRRAY